MIYKKLSLVFLSALCFLLSCSPDDPIGITSKYYILTDVHEQNDTSDFVLFTTCEMPAFSVAKSTNRTKFKGGDVYCDIVGDDNALYAARFRCDTIEVIDYKTFSVSRKISFAHSGNTFQKHLAVTKNKLFVTSAGYVSGTGTIPYIRAIDMVSQKIDSIPVNVDSEIWAITAINEKVFVSVGNYYPAPQIIAYDAQTYDSLGATELPGMCSELYNDGNSNILAMTYSKLSFIDSKTLTITSTKETFAQSLTNPTFENIHCNTSYAFNKSDNTLYFAQAAPQPAVAPYRLSSYNLTTDKITVMEGVYINANTISYDEKQKLILVGAGSKLTMYKKNGDVFGEFSTGYPANKVVVRYLF